MSPESKSQIQEQVLDSEAGSAIRQLCNLGPGAWPSLSFLTKLLNRIVLAS